MIFLFLILALLIGIIVGGYLPGWFGTVVEWYGNLPSLIGGLVALGVFAIAMLPKAFKWKKMKKMNK